MGSGKKTVPARRISRLRAVQALFQMEASGAGLEQVVEDFNSGLLDDGDDGPEFARSDLAFFRSLLEFTLSHQRQIDRLTSDQLKDGWKIDRIDPTLRALFRAAGAELLLKRTPLRVTISEFVEIAKAFFPDGKAAGFVNGVLDGMARSARPGDFAHPSEEQSSGPTEIS
ncbi:MAG: transcription antitermination factor NusB [Rhodobacteraceae bacterium]|nr:transcription antitermination factor NusB [Paracoccaceae bacterium]